MRRSKIVVLAILLLALIGLLVPYTIDNGIAKFRRDPVEYRVAMNALQAYWSLNRDRGFGLLSAHARVTRVWVEKGHCNDPRATGETADYRAEVRGVSWFGIPGRTLEVFCGGLQRWYRK